MTCMNIHACMHQTSAWFSVKSDFCNFGLNSPSRMSSGVKSKGVRTAVDGVYLSLKLDVIIIILLQV